MDKLSTNAMGAIRALIRDLVEGNFAALDADGRVGRLTEGELRHAIQQYGRTLIAIPEVAYQQIDIFVTNKPGETGVDVPLWTEEEGRSDLTLSLTVLESGDETRVWIDDLHVL